MAAAGAIAAVVAMALGLANGIAAAGASTHRTPHAAAIRSVYALANRCLSLRSVASGHFVASRLYLKPTRWAATWCTTAPACCSPPGHTRSAAFAPPARRPNGPPPRSAAPRSHPFDRERPPARGRHQRWRRHAVGHARTPGPLPVR